MKTIVQPRTLASMLENKPPPSEENEFEVPALNLPDMGDTMSDVGSQGSFHDYGKNPPKAGRKMGHLTKILPFFCNVCFTMQVVRDCPIEQNIRDHILYDAQIIFDQEDVRLWRSFLDESGLERTSSREHFFGHLG